MLIEDAEAPEGVELYDFEDYDMHRRLIFDDAKSALESQFPKAHNGVRMELSGLQYVDPDHYSISDQKRALHKDKFLMRRLKGKVRLLDEKTGQLLDEKDMTLMRVPYLTERGTFIRGGNEWATIGQTRLLPGAYSRYQNNGDLETQFNVRTGTGGAFRISFNPESTQYKMTVGGSQVHLYSLLHDMGVSDDVLRERWGDAVFEANQAKYDGRTLDNAYKKIVPTWMRDKEPNKSPQEKAEAIKAAWDKAQMSTKVAKKTLPSLFSLTKAASWRSASKVDKLFAKCASLGKYDLQELAAYINENCGKSINLEAGKDELEEQIRNVIRTGYAEMTGQTDPSDRGATLVRQMQAKRTMDGLEKEIGKYAI